MITKAELNPHGLILSATQEENLEKLYVAMNKLRAAYGKPMIVTSGVRTREDQLRINPRNPGSAHTMAAACDIADKDKKLCDWVLDNFNLIIELDLYIEDPDFCQTWLHIQCLPPKSGKRIFIP